jgi:signal transduction histidine kinase
MRRRVPRRLLRSLDLLQDPIFDPDAGEAVDPGVVAATSTRVESPSHLAVSEDRERIAADLHDTVIQQLYATGLGLQACLRVIRGPEALKRVEAAITEIDDVIHHIRSTIFDLGAVEGDALEGQAVAAPSAGEGTTDS